MLFNLLHWCNKQVQIKANKIINTLLPGTSSFHSPVICTSISYIKKMCLIGSMFLEESLKGQQGGWAEGIRGLVVAVASSPVGDATSGEGLCLWKGKHERGCEGGAGRCAGHHGRAQGLKVIVIGWVVKGLPVLSCVDGVGQVDLWHWPRRLHLRLCQQIQRLLQNRGVQVGHLHRAVGDGGGGQDRAAATAGEDRVGGRGEGWLAGSDSGGLWLWGHTSGEAGVGRRHGDHREICI